MDSGPVQTLLLISCTEPNTCIKYNRRATIEKRHLQQIVLSCVYTLGLIGPISYLGACYIRTKVTKCIPEKMSLHTFVGESLNHIHQDTKSARLIAVCERSFKARLHGRFFWRFFSFWRMRLSGWVTKVLIYIDVFHKWRLWHGNDARMFFSRSILVSNYQTDMISFLAFSRLSIRVSFEG